MKHDSTSKAALYSTAMRRKSIPVADLQFGMYIAELDRPWTETPFMFQGFALSTEQQLQALRRLCKHVFIDVARGTAGAATAAATGAAAPSPSTPAFGIHGTESYSAEEELEHEIEIALALYEDAFAALADFVRPLDQGNWALDGSALERLGKELADSVVRNPDALLLATKLRKTGHAAHARALQVATYMMAFGRFLQRSREEIALLGLLGMLQDVGQARLPAALVGRYALSDEEDVLARKHVELSAQILGVSAGLPPKLSALVLLHHERQDGRGYPRGLRGYQIGLFGSIAAICDAYDAALARPPHGAGLAPADAVKRLLKERGSAFHGPLLEQFVRFLGAFPLGSLVELSTGEIAVVIGENLLQRLKPRLAVVADKGGKPARPRIVDLADAQLRVRRTLEEGAVAFDPASLV